MTARQERLLLTLGSTVALGSAFVAVSSSASPRARLPPAWFPETLDTHLPVVPGTVWLYASWYLAPLLLQLLPRARFRRATIAATLALLVCVTGHLLFPISIARPAINPHGTISEAALALLYSVDPPVSLFPSFHAAIAAIVSWHAPATTRWGQALFNVWMLAICASCVLTRQHYVLDVIGGWIVGARASALSAVILGGDEELSIAPSARSPARGGLSPHLHSGMGGPQ